MNGTINKTNHTKAILSLLMIAYLFTRINEPLNKKRLNLQTFKIHYPSIGFNLTWHDCGHQISFMIT